MQKDEFISLMHWVEFRTIHFELFTVELFRTRNISNGKEELKPQRQTREVLLENFSVSKMKFRNFKFRTPESDIQISKTIQRVDLQFDLTL